MLSGHKAGDVQNIGDYTVKQLDHAIDLNRWWLYEAMYNFEFCAYLVKLIVAGWLTAP
jgi:hypothetical protein